MEQPENRQNAIGFAAGDAEIWRELLRVQIPRLYALFLNRRPNPSLAEELVQTTVFDAVRGLSSYDPARGNPEEWLFGIAHNNIRLEIRKRAARPSIDGDISAYLDLIDASELPDEVLERAETTELVRTALDRLDEKERRVLTAKYIQDLSARQISEQLSITEKAVHDLLYRARISLRDELRRTASSGKEEPYNGT